MKRLTLTHLSLAVIAGTLPLLFLPRLPPTSWIGWLLVAAVIMLRCRWLSGRLAGCALMIFCWATSDAEQLLKQTDSLSRRPVQAQMRLISQTPGGSWRVRLETVDQRILFPPLFATLWHVSFPQPPVIGQRWQARLTLRPVHASLNEGVYDAQQTAVSRRSTLTGRATALHLLSATPAWRAQFIAWHRVRTAQLREQATLLALAFGERAALDAAVRQMMQVTGVMHLMAISGLHVALAMLFGMKLARVIQLFLPAWRIHSALPLASGWIGTVIYVWLSGANPPAVRTLVALTIGVALRLHGLRYSNGQIWLLTLALMLFWQPLQVLSWSFLLSACAVAALIFWFQWYPWREGRYPPLLRGLMALIHLQVGMTLLMLPLQLHLFHGVGVFAVAGNLWAVPLITVITVPLILSALLLTPVPLLSEGAWWLADRSVALVFTGLHWLEQGWLPLSLSWSRLSALLWLVLILWRCAVLARTVWVLAALAFSLWQMPRPAPSPRWQAHMLDIGHGLAVVIERQGHAILFDTGDRWSGGDSGQSVIIPWLRAQGLTVDMIIISHQHRDHQGGEASLVREWPQAVRRASFADAHYLPCRAGEQWRWRGLDFRALWPPQTVEQAGNNQSCVIRIEDGRFVLLLTGDIEAAAERQLVRRQARWLKADVLQVPHHGSRTSSTPAFLRAVQGEAALVSTSRYNRWHLPAASVRARYQQAHYRWYSTLQSGQISVRFLADRWQIQGYREGIAPRWYHQWFGVSAQNR